MDDNQKMLIGCGGVGCTGIIFIAIAAALFYFFYAGIPFFATSNGNASNSNSPDLRSNSNGMMTVSNMSEDDRHKLFQAAGVTRDPDLIDRAFRKIGLVGQNGSFTSEHEGFVQAHAAWAKRNQAFINQYSTPERARQYVLAHLDD